MVASYDNEQKEKLEKVKEELEKDKKEFQEKGLGVDFRDGINYEDIERERDIYSRDQKRIENKYNSKRFPNFRLTAEYLIGKYLDRKYQLSKKVICKDLKMKMGTIDNYLSELNRFEKFQPMRWISIEGKKDWIEVAGIDFRNSNKWIKKNFKGFVSRTARVLQTKEKVRLAEEMKASEKMRQEQKIKISQSSKSK